MTLLYLAFLAGLASAATWLLTRTWFEQPARSHLNVRGTLVPVGVGVLLAPASVIGLVMVRVPAGPHLQARRTSIALVVALTALGLIDDWWGSDAVKGFSGHLGALRRRQLTTGALKLIGGGTVALLAVGALGGTAKRVVLGALIVALAANAANLFDRAPGRLGKVTLVAGTALLLTGTVADQRDLAVVAAMLGALAGLLWFDLGEELMLGDAGANALGGVLGFGVVLTTSPLVQGAVLALLIALNVAGERVSFSAVIARRPFLKELDDLGRRALED